MGVSNPRLTDYESDMLKQNLTFQIFNSYYMYSESCKCLDRIHSFRITKIIHCFNFTVCVLVKLYPEDVLDLIGCFPLTSILLPKKTYFKSFSQLFSKQTQIMDTPAQHSTFNSNIH